jgi:hypothetical protein
LFNNLGFSGEFGKLVLVNEELPQSPTVTAPCRREPTVQQSLAYSLLALQNLTFLLLWLRSKAYLTQASLRQGGGIFARK